MNHSIYSADRTTHLKVVIVALIAGIRDCICGHRVGVGNGRNDDDRSFDSAGNLARSSAGWRIYILSFGRCLKAYDPRHSHCVARHPRRHDGYSIAAAGNLLRNLGVPHIALRKMVSGAIVAAFVAVPLAVLFAVLLAPFQKSITQAAPWIFAVAALAIAYFSPGKWASVLTLIPFVLLIVAVQGLTARFGVKLSISYFLGIAIGPLVADLFAVLSPVDRVRMRRDRMRTFALAPDVKGWSGYFPNPLKVLDRVQLKWTLITAGISSATFVFSPVAMTVLLGEVVGARIKHAYHRLTTVLTARNGVTEATYIAEALIPLIAFGLPLSPVAAGPAAPLFNAPPA